MERMIKCWRGRKIVGTVYWKRLKGCDCLAHEFARAWYKVTGDSWVVHATAVLGAIGAASYMSKYLTKTFAWSQEKRDSVGMFRRWSSSRGWPASERLRLQRTIESGWEEVQYRAGPISDEYLGGPEDLMVRSTDNLVDAAVEKAKVAKLVRKLKGAFHD